MKSAFEHDFDALRSWPHALTAIEDTLDNDLIEGRAMQLLYRALGNGTLVAFLGSGVSAAYGRMSWLQLKAKQIDDIRSVADKFVRLSTDSIMWLEELIKLAGEHEVLDGHDHSHAIDEGKILSSHLRIKRDEIDYQLREIKKLNSTFEALNGSDSALGADIYPIQFQIAKRLTDALQKAEKIFVIRERTLDLRRGVELKHHDIGRFRKLCKYGYAADDGEQYLLQERIKNAIGDRQLDSIYVYRRFKRSFKRYYRVLCRRGINLRFKDNTKYLVYDECAHAEHILTSAMNYAAASGRERWRTAHSRKNSKRTLSEQWGSIAEMFPEMDPARLSRDIKTISNHPSYYQILGFFKKSSVSAICDYVDNHPEHQTDHTGWREITRLIYSTSDLGRSPAFERVIWTPTRRFIVSMLFARQRDPLDCAEFLDLFYDRVEKTDYRARYSLIHEDMDPLAHLSMDLGIKHYLTTNYDLEVERLFADRGYEIRHATGGNQANDHRDRGDLIGGRSLDATFKRREIADLVSFSLDLEGADNSVFHLHGRATADSEIVLTERDYMNLYLLNDMYRDSIDEAIDLAFSSNPVLFVGLGMSEEDVLRPMRQFVSDQERRGDRTAIALMPAIKPTSQRRTESAALYTRYGALTVYYGDALVDGEPQQWLLIVNAVSKALLRFCHARRSALINIRRYIDRLDDRQSLQREYEETPHQFYDNLVESLNFVRRYCVNAGNQSSDDISTNRVNDWLTRECPEISHAINSHSRFQTQYKKDLYSFLADFDISKYLPNLDFSDTGNNDERNPDISFELGILDNLRKIALELRLHTAALQSPLINPSFEESFNTLSKLDVSQVNALIRNYRAIEIGIDGSLASIHTAILCGFLRTLNVQQKFWLKNSQDHPKSRIPRFEIKPYTFNLCYQCGGSTNHQTGICRRCLSQQPPIKRHAELPVRYIRHHIENSFTRLRDNWPNNGNFFSSQPKNSDQTGLYTGVRAYDTFLDSLVQVMPDDDRTPEYRRKRRTYLVAAHRGLGKGVFLSAMASGVGIEGFIRSAWKHDPTDVNQLPVRYRAAIFVNYSFSTEIASTWDMIIDTLITICAEALADEKAYIYPDQFKIPRVIAAYGNLAVGATTGDLKLYNRYRYKLRSIQREIGQLTRVQKLRYLLGKWQDLNEYDPQRVILCLSAVDLLYGSNGVAKNAEIASIMDVLLGDQFQKCPIDLVMVCEEASVPECFRPMSDSPRGSNSPQGTRVHRLITRPSISEYGLRKIEQRLLNCRLQVTCDDSIAPIPHGNAFPSAKPNNQYLHFCRVMQPEIFLIDNFEILASILFLGHLLQDSSFLTDMQRQKLVDGYRSISETHQHSLHLGSRRVYRRALREFVSSQVCELGEGLLTQADREAMNDEEQLNRTILRARYDPPATVLTSDRQHRRFDAESYRGWREIRKRLRHNRFSFTILLAAAEQLAVNQSDIQRAKQVAEEFIESLVHTAGTVSVERREEVLVQQVLHQYESGHRAGDPVRDIDLHYSILRHLAVIGQPCSPDVLVRLPEIRQYFDKNSANRRDSRKELKETYPHRRTGELIQAMDQLERSGLVFKMTAHPLLSGLQEHNQSNSGRTQPTEHGEPTRDLHRYGLHRLIHRHVVIKMGGSLKEFIATNNFASSLYASMPSDLPRPTLATYQFLRQLVSSLSGYPDRYMLDNPTEPWHFNTARNHTRVQALRSALGILRSTFSIAVVSRFEEYQSDIEGDLSVSGKWMNHAGYFEEHRIQVRWLLRQATAITASVGTDTTTTADTDKGGAKESRKAHRQLNAFYRDEVIWLYNECGVICLVQGNLIDAVNLFRHALLCNLEIEGDSEDGAQHCRISLNLAVAQIERGRLDSASARLDSILSHRQPKTELHALATGYRGLVYHLSGERDVALQHYNDALAVTRELQDYRASSIFCRHCGDLHRLREDFDTASRYIQDAIAFAQSGGHEDLYNKALLSQINLLNSIGNENIPKQIQLLRKIEGYAESMDMPTLSCEAMHIRSSLLLNQGEMTLAGKLLQKAIAKAKRNGLQLRMSSALTLYGKVMHQRNQNETSKKLLLTALEMSKTLGIQIEIDRIERQLNYLTG